MTYVAIDSYETLPINDKYFSAIPTILSTVTFIVILATIHDQ
ncbi:hypothetical protein AOT82_1425 [Psychrobacter sp. AntiMn-1]|nr:hypothetical protein AOT82_1425 [Psychrobacter sp. AntiMn-1]